MSRQQSVFHRATLLKGEQLHKSVMRVWNDDSNTVAIARAYAGHHQIVSTILDHNGDNSFLTGRGALHFGIRKRYVANDDCTGVVEFVNAPEEELETRQGAVLNALRRERIVKKLKYELPRVSDLVHGANPSVEMGELLMGEMDHSKANPELLEFWMNQMEGYSYS